MRRLVENGIRCRILTLSRGWNEQLSNLIARQFLKLSTRKYRIVALNRFYGGIKKSSESHNTHTAYVLLKVWVNLLQINEINSFRPVRVKCDKRLLTLSYLPAHSVFSRLSAWLPQDGLS